MYIQVLDRNNVHRRGFTYWNAIIPTLFPTLPFQHVLYFYLPHTYCYQNCIFYKTTDSSLWLCCGKNLRDCALWLWKLGNWYCMWALTYGHPWWQTAALTHCLLFSYSIIVSWSSVVTCSHPLMYVFKRKPISSITHCCN